MNWLIFGWPIVRLFSPLFSVIAVRAGASVHEHFWRAGHKGSTGSLSIVCSVNLIHGIGQGYRKNQSQQDQIVDLVLDYYQATSENKASVRLWGKQLISTLSSSRLIGGIKTGDTVAIDNMVDKRLARSYDGGGRECTSRGCVNPAEGRTSYARTEQMLHEKLHVTPGIWSEAPPNSNGSHFYCSKCPGWRGAGMFDRVDISC